MKRAPDPGPSTGKRTRLELGRTGGLGAIGAWGARFELARLLEARADPLEVVRLVRSGQEGNEPLAPPPVHFDLDEEQSEGEVSAPARPAGMDPLPAWADRGCGVGLESEKPEWAKLPSSSSVPSSQSDLGLPAWARSEESSALGWGKPAKPPSSSAQDLTVKPWRFEQKTGLAEEFSELAFTKSAKPPSHNFVLPEGKEERTTCLPKRVASRHGGPLEAKEAANLKEYGGRAKELFLYLETIGVKMDLRDILGDGGTLDGDTFLLHTMPFRASTGLRRARLLQRLVDWHECQGGNERGAAWQLLRGLGGAQVPGRVGPPRSGSEDASDSLVRRRLFFKSVWLRGGYHQMEAVQAAG